MIRFRYSAVLCMLSLAVMKSGGVLAAEPEPAGGSPQAVNQGEAPQVQIIVSKETTFVTEPLAEHVGVDYVAAINQRFGDVRPEENAAIVLWQLGHEAGLSPEYRAAVYQAWGLEPPAQERPLLVSLQEIAAERGADINDLLRQQSQALDNPWMASKLPAIAAWLEANEAAMAKANEAAGRPRCFFPLIRLEDKPIAEMPWPRGLSASRETARALTARAMLHLQDGQYDAAWEDLLTVALLGRRISQCATVTEGLLGISIEGLSLRGIEQYLQHVPLSAEQVLARRQELENLPPRGAFAEKVHFTERLSVLDGLTHMARGTVKPVAPSGPPTASRANQSGARMIANLIQNQTDWNVALRTVNADFNQYIELLQIDDHSRRFAEMDDFSKRFVPSMNTAALLLEIGRGTDTGEVLGTYVARRFLVMLTPAINAAMAAEAQCVQAWTNLQIAFALAAYRGQHGRYPENLQALQPEFLKEVPRDAFSGKALIYKPSDGGFVLYSVGLNGQDDGGRRRSDDPDGRADDLAVRIANQRP